jgi:hypothetical protein
MPAALLLILAGAILVTAVAYALGWWVRATDAEEHLKDVRTVHKRELAEAAERGFKRGRWQGWHEAHACDTGCLDRILGPVAKTTSNSPEMN